MPLPRLLCVALLTSAAVLVVTPQAARASEQGAGVDAMARIFVGGVKYGVLRDLRQHGGSETTMACIEALDADDIRASVERMFAASLTPDEIREVDAYMAGPVGRRELQVTLASDGREEPPLTPEEKARSVAFSESAVARKLDAAIERDSNDTTTPGAIGHRLTELLQDCFSR